MLLSNKIDAEFVAISSRIHGAATAPEIIENTFFLNFFSTNVDDLENLGSLQLFRAIFDHSDYDGLYENALLGALVALAPTLFTLTWTDGLNSPCPFPKVMEHRRSFLGLDLTYSGP